MPYGFLSPEQERVFQDAVRGRDVVDLGAGDGVRAEEAAQAGARSVLALDKEKPSQLSAGFTLTVPPFWAPLAPSLGEALSAGERRFVVATCERWAEVAPAALDLVLLFWPINHPVPGLLTLVERASSVLYLGSNTNGSACGTPWLFASLIKRPVLAFVQGARNDLLLYGSGVRGGQELLREERAGLTAWEGFEHLLGPRQGAPRRGMQ